MNALEASPKVGNKHTWCNTKLVSRKIIKGFSLFNLLESVMRALENSVNIICALPHRTDLQSGIQINNNPAHHSTS
jgi:hypothetical protein